jgi:hypothetical protein
VYVPWPKFDPDRADAFIFPVQVAVLLLIGHGVWNLTAPKLSTLPEDRPSLLETTPSLTKRYRVSVRDAVPLGLGYLKKKLYAPSNLATPLGVDGRSVTLEQSATARSDRTTTRERIARCFILDHSTVRSV